MQEKLALALEYAREELGTKEVPGKGNNPVIIGYGKTAGIPDYSADSTPWCAVFVGAMLAKAGLENTGNALARSYMHWGRAVETPYPGCIAVFKRGTSTWQGHVGFYDGPAGDGKIKLLGGNQAKRGGRVSDRVSIKTTSTEKLLGYREADTADAEPSTEPDRPTPKPPPKKRRRPGKGPKRSFFGWLFGN